LGGFGQEEEREGKGGGGKKVIVAVMSVSLQPGSSWRGILLHERKYFNTEIVTKNVNFYISGHNPPALQPYPGDLKHDSDEIANSLLGK
jgi:hypothetical protein